MLIVIPVSQADAHLVDNVEKGFALYNPGRNHSLLVVAPPNAKQEAQHVCDRLARFFVTAREHIFHTDADLGWPRAMNFFFQQTCYQVFKELPPNQGWLWYELDTLPLAPSWLDRIEEKYYSDAHISVKEGRQMHRFMGVKDATIRGFQGELMPQDVAGFHMAAVGVYPADIANTLPIISALTGGNQPFYHKIQWYSTKSLQETELIQNNWRTYKYVRNEDEITCSSYANWAWNIHYNNPIKTEAVLLHGCKDQSLINILLEGVEVVKEETKNDKPTKIVLASELASSILNTTTEDPYKELAFPRITKKWRTTKKKAKRKYNKRKNNKVEDSSSNAKQEEVALEDSPSTEAPELSLNEV